MVIEHLFIGKALARLCEVYNDLLHGSHCSGDYSLVGKGTLVLVTEITVISGRRGT